MSQSMPEGALDMPLLLLLLVALVLLAVLAALAGVDSRDGADWSPLGRGGMTTGTGPPWRA
jgi:hypothetical protein